MSQQETAAPAPSPKKKVRQEVGEKLAGALAEYKQDLGEKTLATHVKKISKLISRDLERVSKKRQQDSKRTAAKKTAAEKTAAKKTTEKKDGTKKSSKTATQK